MPVTTKTTTFTEEEIREALAEWFAARHDGDRVDPRDFILFGDDDAPLPFLLAASVDH